MAKLSMSLGFNKGVSVDVSYLKISYVLEYYLPYMQSDFTCNPGPTYTWQLGWYGLPSPSTILELPASVTAWSSLVEGDEQLDRPNSKKWME